MPTKNKTLGFLARNQYGESLNLTEPRHPRKQLLAKLGRKHAAKMYVDTTKGEVRHVGWIVAGQWWTVYRACPLK